MTKWAWIILGVLLVVALALRIPLLTGSFWLDEAAQALQSARPLTEQLQIRHDFQPPLLHLVTFLAIQFDDSEWWLRTWGALIPSLLSIVFTFFIAKSLFFNQRFSLIVASVSSLLLLTSSFHIFYSQELRPYALPLFFAAFSWFLLIKLKLVPIGSRFWWGFALLFSVTSLLGLYASYLYPFVLLGQFAYVSALSIMRCSRLEWKPSACCQQLSWVVVGLLIVIGFLPWLPSFLDQLNVGQSLRASLPNWESVVSTPQIKALALVKGKFIFGVLDIEPNMWFIFAFGTILVLFLVVSLNYIQLLKKTLSIKEKSEHFHALSVVFCWLVLPILLAWIVSFAVPVLQAKRVLFALPAWYLFVTIVSVSAVSYSKSTIAKLISFGLIGLLLLINLFGVVQYWTNPRLQRENWQAAYLKVQSVYGENIPKIFIFDAPFSPWVWYDSRYGSNSKSNTFNLTHEYTATPQSASNLVQRATQNFTISSIVYFDYLTDLSDPDRYVIQSLNEAGYQQTDLLDYANIGFIRIFEKDPS